MHGKEKSPRSRLPKQRKTSLKAGSSTVDLVKDGVRRFILSDASMGDFYTSVTAASKKGELSPNPLTGAVFRKIVKEAIREQKQRRQRKSRGR